MASLLSWFLDASMVCCAPRPCVCLQFNGLSCRFCFFLPVALWRLKNCTLKLGKSTFRSEKCHFEGLQQKKSMALSEGCLSTLMSSFFWYIALVNTKLDQRVIPKIQFRAPDSKLKNRHFLDYGQARPGQSITGL